MKLNVFEKFALLILGSFPIMSQEFSSPTENVLRIPSLEGVASYLMPVLLVAVLALVFALLNATKLLKRFRRQ